MKKFKKIKIGLLSLALVLLSVVTFFSFKASATSATVTYRYEVYTKEEYEACNYTIEATDGTVFTRDQIKAAITAAGAAGEALIPTLWPAVTDPGKKGISYEQAKALEDAASALTLTPITAVTPGQDVVVVAYATLSDNGAFQAAVVALDINKYKDASNPLKFYNSPEVAKGSSYTNDATNAVIGFDYATGLPSATYPTGEVTVGAIGFTISPTVSSMTINFTPKSASLAGLTNYTTAADNKSYNNTYGNTTAQNRFNEVPLNLSVAAKSSDTTLITLTVEGKDALGGGSVSGASSTSYKGSETSDGTANIIAAVKDNGTITGARYSTNLADVDGTNPTGGTTVSPNAGQINVPMGSVNPGQSMYCAIQATASDGTTTKWYVVELPKAKDTNCNLENALFTGQNSSGTTVTLGFQGGITPNYATTTAFTVLVPKGTTNVQFTPTFTSPKTANINANTGWTDVSGTAVTVTGLAAVRITVRAQDTTKTKEYTFTMLEVDTTPSSISTTANGVTDTDTDSDGDKYYDLTVPAGFRNFTLAATLPTGATATIKYNGTNTANWNGSAKTITLAEADDSKAITNEIITLEVDNNGTKETYYVRISRDAADKDGTFTIVDTKYFATASDTTGTAFTVSNTSGVTWSNSAKIPYGTYGVQYRIVPTSSTTKVFIGSTEITGVQNLVLSSATLVSFRIQTELDRVKGQQGTDYKLQINLDQPEGLPSTFDLKLLSSTDGAILDNTYAPTMSNSNTKYTYRFPKSVGNTYKMQINVNTTKSKIYVTQTKPTNASNLSTADEYNSAATYPVGTTTVAQTRFVTVVAQNGNYKTYEVEVFEAKETENRIKDIRIFDPETGNNIFTFNESTTQYLNTPTVTNGVRFPYSVKTINYEVELYSTKESLTSTGAQQSTSTTLIKKYTLDITANNQIVSQASAEDGTKGQSYTIAVTRDSAKTGQLIDTLSIFGINCKTADPNHFASVFDSTKNTWTIFFDRNEIITTDNILITVSDGATFEITVGTNTQSGSPNPYTLTLSPGDKVQMLVKVLSEKNRIDGGNPNTYTINLVRGEKDKDLDNIEILDSLGGSATNDINGSVFNFNSGSLTQTKFVVPYAQSSVYLSTTLPSTTAYATIEYKVGSGSYQSSPTINLTAGQTTTVTVRITSELGKLDSSIPNQTKEYVIPIERKDCEHHIELSNLQVLIDGSVQTYAIPSDGQFKPAVTQYIIEQLSAGSNTAIFQYTKSDSKSKVSINGNSAPSESNSNTQGNISVNYNLPNNPGATSSETITVDVACECGKHANHYNVKLTTGKAVLGTTASLDSVKAYTALTGANDVLKTDPGNGSYSPTSYNYIVNLTGDSSDDYAYLDVEKSDANATLYYKVGSNPEQSLTNNGRIEVLNVGYGETISVVIRVVAEDGKPEHTTSNYTIKVKRAAEPSHNAKLNDLKINGNIAVPGFQPTDEGGNYTVYLEDATDAYATLTLGDSKASIDTKVSSPYLDAAHKLTLQYGSNNVITIVTKAEDGTTTHTYILTIVKDYPKTLENLEVIVDGNNRITYNKTQNNYKVSLTYSEDSAKIVYLLTDPNSDGSTPNRVELIDKDGNVVSGDTFTNIPTGKNTYKVRITAPKPAGSDKYKEYNIEFDRAAGKSDAEIITYEYLKGATDTTYINVDTIIQAGKTEYSYVVERDNLTFNPKITVSAGATWRIKGTTNSQSTTLSNQGKKNTIYIEVIPEDASASPKTYIFNVYPCDEDFDIDDVNALVAAGGDHTKGSDGTSFIDYENGVYSISVPNTTTTTYLEVLGGGYGSQIYINGAKYTNQLQSLSEGANTYVIYIKSEYGEANSSATNAQSASVTVTITREALSDDNDLILLEVSYVDADGNTQTVSHQSLPSTTPLVVPELPLGVKNIFIKATPKDDPKAKVIAGIGSFSLDMLPESNGVFNIDVICQSESGKQKTYPVTISRQKIDLSTDNSITYIIVEADGKTYLDQATFDPTTNSYGKYKIPFSAKDYTITVVKTANSPSETWIDGQSVSPLTYLKTTITSAMRGTSKQIPVYCLAQKDGSKGPEYTIELEFEEGSSDVTLKELLADGVMVPGFSPTDRGGEYELGVRPYTVDKIDFTYVTSDPKATVRGHKGVQDLKVGDNLFRITVIAEDGSEEDYIIHVKRDYPLPYLTDLNVVGEQLLNASEKETTFDKDVYTYNVIVTYNTLTATINTTVDNEDYNVAASNCTVLNNTGLTRTFTTNLEIGPNPITFTVVSKDGKSVEYKLIIQRRDKDSANANAASIEILQIPVFKDEYSNLTRDYAYVVPNGIRNLDVIVHPEKGPDAKGDGATYKVVNDKNLRVGHNTVVILIIAEDQVTTKAILVDVERLPMSYTVNDKAYDYTCTKLPGQNAYEIDLVDKRADAIEDYTKYIVFPEEAGDPYDKTNQYSEKPVVTVVSDLTDKNCREVVLRIYDGDQEEFVTLKLKSSALTNGMSIPEVLRTIFPWILLVIAIIILIFILICVNRDKFGSINKKRKKEED